MKCKHTVNKYINNRFIFIKINFIKKLNIILEKIKIECKVASEIEDNLKARLGAPISQTDTHTRQPYKTVISEVNITINFVRQKYNKCCFLSGPSLAIMG